MEGDFVLESDGAIIPSIRMPETANTELVALTGALQAGLYDAFCEASRLTGGISGRVIVTGIRKSGHIDAKTAATLTYADTPSFFAHIVEANDGDPGMIARDEVVFRHILESRDLRASMHYQLYALLPNSLDRLHLWQVFFLGAGGQYDFPASDGERGPPTQLSTNELYADAAIACQ